VLGDIPFFSAATLKLWRDVLDDLIAVPRRCAPSLRSVSLPLRTRATVPTRPRPSPRSRALRSSLRRALSSPLLPALRRVPTSPCACSRRATSLCCSRRRLRRTPTSAAHPRPRPRPRPRLLHCVALTRVSPR
jgi:hypothetical protein